LRNLIIVTAATAALAGCGQTSQKDAETKTAAVEKAPERVPYCFFKDSEAKGWSTATDKQGNVVLRGKLYRQDSRYEAFLEKPRVEGTSAEVWPNIRQNSGAYGAPDDWWPVTITIPASTAVTKVSVRCGAKIMASLDVARKK
jgi:hypothetical protein